MTVESSAPAADRRAGTPQGITLVVTAFLPIMAIVSLAPALPSIIKHFSAEPQALALSPLMITAPGLMIALLSPLMGWAADKFGRRPVIVWATFFYGFLGMLPFFLDKLVPIFASRLALGVAEAAILTVCNTLIADYFDDARRRRWLTIQGIVGPVFGTSVIMIAGGLTDHFWNGAFLIYAVAFPIFCMMLAFVFEPQVTAEREPANEEAEPFPWTTVLGLVAVTLFSAILYYGFIVQGGLAYQAVGVTSPSRTGFLISIASIGVFLGAIMFGVLSKRIGIPALIAIYLMLLGVGMIGIGLSTDPVLTTALASIQQLGAGMCVPTLILWAARCLPPRHRGRGMGAWSSAFFLGQFASPLFFGWARTATGGGALGAFTVYGVVAILGAIAALIIGRLRRAPQVRTA